jgi:hypothetical protein
LSRRGQPSGQKGGELIAGRMRRDVGHVRGLEMGCEYASDGGARPAAAEAASPSPDFGHRSRIQLLQRK